MVFSNNEQIFAKSAKITQNLNLKTEFKKIFVKNLMYQYVTKSTS